MRRAVALFALGLLVAGCGGVDGAELFADTPITPPICPIAEDEGACDEQPTGPLHLVPAPALGHANPPNLADQEAKTSPEAPADPTDITDGGLSAIGVAAAAKGSA